MKVLVDPRIELLSVIQLLGNYGKKYGLVTENQTDYKTSILEWFSSGKEHSAVKISDKLGDDGFSFDAPHCLMLHLINPPELKLKLPLSDYLIERADGKEPLNKYISSFKEFAAEHDFMDFYKQSSVFYENLLGNFNESSPNVNYNKQLEEYYGKDPGNFITILSPVLRGNFGLQIENNLYCIMGINGTTEFDINRNDMLQHLVWHEMSHSLINPLTAKYEDIIKSTEALYKPIEEKMRSQAYATWETCVNEHVIRAITNRLAFNYFGEDTYKRLISIDMKKGFIYLQDVIHSLIIYEQNRDEYKTIDLFYKNIMNTFLSKVQ